MNTNLNNINIDKNMQYTLAPEYENALMSALQKYNKQTILDQPKQPHIKKSKFTSTGKPKPQAAEPIRSLDDIKLIQDYFLNKEDYRDYMMFTVGISIGLRISDLMSLKLSDVMYDKDTFRPYIDIVEQKTDKNSSNASDECLLTKLTTDTIELYLCSLEDYSMDDYLFPSQKGGHLDTRSAHKILKQMSRDLGLDKKYNISSHTLRKTFAYWVIKLNPNDNEALFALQMQLKHSSIRSTFCYSGITKDKTRESREKLSDFYEGVM